MGRPFPGGDSSWLQPTIVLTTERRVEKATRVPDSLNLRAPELCVIFKGLTGPLRGRSKCPVLLQAIGHESLNLSRSEPALCVSLCMHLYPDCHQFLHRREKQLFLQRWFERIVGSAALLREMAFKIFFEMLFHGPGFWSVSGSFSVTWLSQKGGTGR